MASDATILVVEDDADVAQAIVEVLAAENFRAIVARTVDEAKRLAKRERPAIVFLDWCLPDGTGEDVVRAIRPDDPSVPIVVMSGAREALDASQAVEPRERLAKPFSLERLVALAHAYAR